MSKLANSVKSILSSNVGTKAFGMTAARNLSSKNESLEFNTLKVTNPHEFVFHVELNRPEKRNAMSPQFFDELTECFHRLSYNPDCRSIVLSGKGKGFTAGLDLSELSNLMMQDTDCVGRKFMYNRKIIDDWQASMSSPETCRKPVIAAVHGHCVGGGVDLITACDIRYCSKDAWFTVKEVDLGLAADIGTLQRFPKVVGNQSLARELIYTARKFTAEEAKELGLISKILPDQEACVNESMELAKLIASKSPIAVQGSKINVNFARDHSVAAGLQYTNVWNSGMIQAEDTMKAAMSALAKEEPVFSKL